MMQQLFQPGGGQTQVATLFENFLNGIGGDVNIAELDTRTFHNPAPPDSSPLSREYRCPRRVRSYPSTSA
jgi:hypothetical protein